MLGIFHMPAEVKAQRHPTPSALPRWVADLCVNTELYSNDAITGRPCSTCRNPAQKKALIISPSALMITDVRNVIWLLTVCH